MTFLIACYSANEAGERSTIYQDYQRVHQIISSVIDTITEKDFQLRGDTNSIDTSLDALMQELQNLSEALHADFRGKNI